MDGKDEYIGRPLNVAARLQGAIKDKDKHPQGKVLLSKTAYVRMQAELKGQFPVDDVTRTLRNISGGANYHAKSYTYSSPKTATGLAGRARVSAGSIRATPQVLDARGAP